MTRMTQTVKTLSTMIQPKAIPKLAVLSVISWIAYCTSEDREADIKLIKSLEEAKPDPNKSKINYDQLSLSAGKPFQRCRATLTMFNPVDYNPVKITSNETCRTVHDLLTKQLEKDTIHRSQSTVHLAISTRNLFSPRTKLSFVERNLTVGEARTATTMVKSSIF